MNEMTYVKIRFNNINSTAENNEFFINGWGLI